MLVLGNQFSGQITLVKLLYLLFGQMLYFTQQLRNAFKLSFPLPLGSSITETGATNKLAN